MISALIEFQADLDSQGTIKKFIISSRILKCQQKLKARIEIYQYIILMMKYDYIKNPLRYIQTNGIQKEIYSVMEYQEQKPEYTDFVDRFNSVDQSDQCSRDDRGVFVQSQVGKSVKSVAEYAQLIKRFSQECLANLRFALRNFMVHSTAPEYYFSNYYTLYINSIFLFVNIISSLIIILWGIDRIRF